MCHIVRVEGDGDGVGGGEVGGDGNDICDVIASGRL